MSKFLKKYAKAFAKTLAITAVTLASGYGMEKDEGLNLNKVPHGAFKKNPNKSFISEVSPDESSEKGSSRKNSVDSSFYESENETTFKEFPPMCGYRLGGREVKGKHTTVSYEEDSMTDRCPLTPETIFYGSYTKKKGFLDEFDPCLKDNFCQARALALTLLSKGLYKDEENKTLKQLLFLLHKLSHLTTREDTGVVDYEPVFSSDDHGFCPGKKETSKIYLQMVSDVWGIYNKIFFEVFGNYSYEIRKITGECKASIEIKFPSVFQVYLWMREAVEEKGVKIIALHTFHKEPQGLKYPAILLSHCVQYPFEEPAKNDVAMIIHSYSICENGAENGKLPWNNQEEYMKLLGIVWHKDKQYPGTPLKTPTEESKFEYETTVKMYAEWKKVVAEEMYKLYGQGVKETHPPLPFEINHVFAGTKKTVHEYLGILRDHSDSASS